MRKWRKAIRRGRGKWMMFFIHETRRVQKEYRGCKNFISSRQAAKLGYKSFYFTWHGMGDQLMFMNCLREYYKKTGVRPLCAVHSSCMDFFKDLDYCYVLNDVPSRMVLEKIWQDIKQIDTESYVFKRCGVKFKPKFVSWGRRKKMSEGRFITAYPTEGKHLITYLCEAMLLSGPVEIGWDLALSLQEKQFGKFAHPGRKQVAIMTGGQLKYKYLSLSKAQEIVNRLKDKYDFVQVGGKIDPLLDGVVNMNNQELSYRQCAAILSNSDLFVGTIGGLQCLARSVGCPSVIAYTAEPKNFVNYNLNENVFPDQYCSLCENNSIHPTKQACPCGYKCINSISVEKMIQAIEHHLALDLRANPPASQIEIAEPATNAKANIQSYVDEVLGIQVSDDCVKQWKAE